jgi:hypothetical protein
MRRRSFIKTLTGGALGWAAAPRMAVRAQAALPQAHTRFVVWKPMAAPPPDTPSLNGHTDTLPDIVGRLGQRIDLAIFTKRNHFPALLSPDILERFRASPAARQLKLDNIVVVTLPQPIIVAMLRHGRIAFGNLTIGVNRESGFYPDIVMGGEAPLKELRATAIVDAPARVFAVSRGLSLLVANDNPVGISSLKDLALSSARVVMAGKNEPCARQQYIAALRGLIGQESTTAIMQRETTDFPGRLGIQRRDVLQAAASGEADVGIIVHHIARYFAANYCSLCAMVEVPDAENFCASIAMASAVDPPRAQAAKAFTDFFMSVAREVYPRYGFATMSEGDFGASLALG